MGQKSGKRFIPRQRWRRTVREVMGENLSCAGASLGCPAHLIFFPHGPGRFITTKGKRLCAPLQAPWVVRLQEKLDASSARKVRASPVLIQERGSPWVGLPTTKQAFPSLTGLLGRAGTALLRHGYFVSVTIPPPSNWDQSGSSAIPLPPQINAALGLLPTQCHPELSPKGAAAKSTGNKLRPHTLLPCKLGVCNLCIFTGRPSEVFGGCIANPARSPLHHHGLASGGHPLVTIPTVGKGPWGGSCPEDQNTDVFFTSPRPNPRASRLRRSPWPAPAPGVGPDPSCEPEANEANLLPPPSAGLTLLGTRASAQGWAEPCLLSLAPSVSIMTQQPASG